MKKKIQKIFPFLMLIGIGALIILGDRLNTKHKNLAIEGKEYKLEIADTPQKRQRGLMEREFLPEDEGMLFIFPQEGYHSFWMYNTKIPLKMIWLDSNWEVVHVEESVPPCKESNPLKCPSYKPTKPARYVVEVNP